MSNLDKSIVLQFSIFTNTPYNIHTTEIYSTGVMVHTRTGDIKEESRTKQNDSRDAAYDQPHVLISNPREDKTAGCGLPESHRIARRAPSYPVIGSNTNTDTNTNTNTNKNENSNTNTEPEYCRNSPFQIS